MKKYIVILTLLSFVKVFAQDPIHTQFFMIPETLSSSFTGAKKSTRAGIIHRTQWPGLNFSLNTQFAFVDNWFDKFNDRMENIISDKYLKIDKMINNGKSRKNKK